MFVVKVETTQRDEEIDADRLLCGEPGILTRIPSVSSLQPGDIVIGGCEQVTFPKSKSYDAGDMYRCRRLRKGERVIFEGLD